MKATGIVRKVDELGRIVLPIELRRTLDIEIKDPVEIFVDEDFIILRKYEPAPKLEMSIDNLISKMKGCKSELSGVQQKALSDAVIALEKFKTVAKK